MNIFVTIQMAQGLVEEVRAFKTHPSVRFEEHPDKYWDNGTKIFEVKLEERDIKEFESYLNDNQRSI